MRSTQDLHSASATVSLYLFIFYTIFSLIFFLLVPAVILFVLILLFKNKPLDSLNFFERISTPALSDVYYPLNSAAHFCVAIMLFLAYHKI